MNDLPYAAETDGIVVRVRPRYLPEQSDPSSLRWVFAYHVEIVNASGETVTLLRRRWRITDGLGRTEVVEGEGVIGETPTLHPGEAYAYVSGCPLQTPSGAMVGAYLMRTADGRTFEAEIPAFSLDTPEPRTVN
jgi:ApaG protein